MEKFPFPSSPFNFFLVFLIVPSFFNAVMSRQSSHLMYLIPMDSTPVKSYSNLSVKHSAKIDSLINSKWIE